MKLKLEILYDNEPTVGKHAVGAAEFNVTGAVFRVDTKTIVSEIEVPDPAKWWRVASVSFRDVSDPSRIVVEVRYDDEPRVSTNADFNYAQSGDGRRDQLKTRTIERTIEVPEPESGWRIAAVSIQGKAFEGES